MIKSTKNNYFKYTYTTPYDIRFDLGITRKPLHLYDWTYTTVIYPNHSELSDAWQMKIDRLLYYN